MTTLCFGHYTYKLRKVKRGTAEGAPREVFEL